MKPSLRMRSDGFGILSLSSHFLSDFGEIRQKRRALKAIKKLPVCWQ